MSYSFIITHNCHELLILFQERHTCGILTYCSVQKWIIIIITRQHLLTCSMPPSCRHFEFLLTLFAYNLFYKIMQFKLKGKGSVSLVSTHGSSLTLVNFKYTDQGGDYNCCGHRIVLIEIYHNYIS